MRDVKKIGAILVNLGTPDSPTPDAVKRYLTEFLLDRHVVDLPPFFWSLLLKYIILPRRVTKTASNYAKIWTDSGSPLLVYSQELTEAVAKRLPDIECELAMTYGNPDLHTALAKLHHCDVIKIIPLFPQYSTTTTLAVLDKVKQLINNNADSPIIEYIDDYVDQPRYIEALITHIEAAFTQYGVPETLLLSYHGIPVRYIKKRHDNYVTRCNRTTAHITKALSQKGITVNIRQSFQSRFGKGEWTSPDTTTELTTLAEQGQKHVQVLCPGFAVDCIETIEEIALFNKQQFLSAGGETFYYIPALNSSIEHTDLMVDLITQHRMLRLK